MKAVEAGIFNDTTAERMKVLESQRSMLNDALLAEQNRREFDLKPGTVLRFLDSFIGDINNPDTRRKLLDGLVDKIYAYPDKLAVACFYSDDRRELPFDETVQLIENRKAIRSLANGIQYVPTELSETMLQSLLEDADEDEEISGFFP